VLEIETGIPTIYPSKRAAARALNCKASSIHKNIKSNNVYTKKLIISLEKLTKKNL
jgi:hypothetical protein